jgi:enoyl-CoA hydratase
MNRPIRVLIAKVGLDGHDRGAKVIASFLRDAGMEVIYTGLRQTPEMVVNAALQEDVDAIGISILSGAHNTVFPKVIALMKEKGMSDVLLTGGGIIPDQDMARLSGLGDCGLHHRLGETKPYLLKPSPMQFENLLTSLDNGVFTITVNRPDKLNALNKKTVAEIGKAIQEAYDNEAIRAVLITGSGTKAFVAGADISEFQGMSAAEGRSLAKAGQDVFLLVEQCPKPVVAAVNGFALGGGCELAMACHIRVASDNARFGQPEVKLGLIPGYGGTQRLVQLIGKGKASELLMTADMLGAGDALKLGLVNYVTSPEQLIPQCLEIIEKIRAQAPTAISGIIRAVNAYYTEGTDGYETELNEFGKCCDTEDFKEGTGAFLEKRKPSFPGR